MQQTLTWRPPPTVWRLGLLWLLVAAVLGTASPGLGADLPMADVTIEVVDEDGTPVADALVYVAFQQGRSDAERRGVTDAKGLWRVQERASPIESFCSVKRKGYYESIQRLDFTRNVPKGVQVTRRWPAMTCRVVLRPIGEPALGFGQGHDLDHHPLRYPAGLDGQEIGYDFLIGDWVSPHGKGVQTDMLVSIQVDPAFRYSLRFPRPGDGLIRIPHDAFHYQCDFKWPRLAPLVGYIAEWRLDTINGAEVTVPEGSKPNGPLFLRIRTESNDRGEVTKAYYGRVGWPANTSDAHGGGIIVARNPRNYPNGGLIFVYSLNLSGTRTMDMRPADAAGSR